MPDIPPTLSEAEKAEWQRIIAIADYHNILCHCRVCDREWVTSAPEPCTCGSRNIQHIACWQFPDD